MSEGLGQTYLGTTLVFVRGQWEVQVMGNKQQEGIRRTALECLEHYELIIRRIRNLCADFDSKDLIDPKSMALQLRLLFIDSSSRTGGRSVMNLMGVTNSQRILSTVPQRISERTISSVGFLGMWLGEGVVNKIREFSKNMSRVSALSNNPHPVLHPSPRIREFLLLNRSTVPLRFGVLLANSTPVCRSGTSFLRH